MRSGFVSVCIAMGLALGLTMMLAHRHLLPLDGVEPEDQDYQQMVWNLWTTNESLAVGRDPYRAPHVFYPLGADLSRHTLAPGYFPLTWVVDGVTGADPLYPVYAMRIAMFGSLWLLALSGYALGRACGFRRWGCAIAAAGFAFSNFFMANATHLNHVSFFVVVFAAAALVRGVRAPTPRRLFAVAAWLAATLYFTELALFGAVGLVLFAALLALRASERRRLLAAAGELGRARIASAAVLALVLASPVLWKLATGAEVLRSPRVEHSFFSANLATFFVPGIVHRPWTHPGTPLYGGLFEPLARHITEGVGAEAFLGYPLLLLAALGVARAGTYRLRCAAGVAVLFLVLALGPTLKVFAVDTGIALPYAPLSHVPPFDLIRTPVRYVSVALLLLMVAAAAGASWLEVAVAGRWGRRVAHGVMGLVLVWTIAERYTPLPRIPSFAPSPQLALLDLGPVANLPLQWLDGHGALLQTIHHQPIVTGYVARRTREQRAQRSALGNAYLAGPGALARVFDALGVRSVVVSESSPSPLGPVTFPFLAVLRQAAFHLVDLRPEADARVVWRFGGVHRNGLAADAPGVVTLDPGVTHVVDVGRRLRASRLELLVDADDVYEVRGLLEGRVVWRRRLAPGLGDSLQWRVAALPDVRFDAVAIVAVRGTRPFALGSLWMLCGEGKEGGNSNVSARCDPVASPSAAPGG